MVLESKPSSVKLGTLGAGIPAVITPVKVRVPGPLMLYKSTRMLAIPAVRITITALRAVMEKWCEMFH